MNTGLNRSEALAGIQQLIQTPLARGAVRYWWVTVPLGALGWHYWKQRSAKGEANVGHLVQDMVPAVGLVATLLTLNALLGKQEAKVSALPPGPIKDADFTASQPVTAEVVA